MKRINWRKKAIAEVLDRNPEGYQVKNKYKVLRAILRGRYPEFGALRPELILDIIFDAVNGNRDWQMMTEEHDRMNKKVLGQQWALDNGYGPRT